MKLISRGLRDGKEQAIGVYNAERPHRQKQLVFLDTAQPDLGHCKGTAGQPAVCNHTLLSSPGNPSLFRKKNQTPNFSFVRQVFKIVIFFHLHKALERSVVPKMPQEAEYIYRCIFYRSLKKKNIDICCINMNNHRTIPEFHHIRSPTVQMFKK